jgi:hypothetical protein
MPTSAVDPPVREQQIVPFREHQARVDTLKELKCAVVRLGLCGDRRSLELARRLFIDIPGLSEA